MSNLDSLLKAPSTFQVLTGLTPRQFESLLSQVEPLYRAADAARRASKPNRKRKTGAGKKLKLSVSEVLFMQLLYYRTYVNHIFLGFLMGIDDGNVCRYFDRMEPVLAQVFRIPETKINMTKDEVWELIVDATEQRTDRSDGSGYSGKKKTHTVKTQTIVSRDRHIKSVSKTTPYQVPDVTLYRKTKAFVTSESIKAHGKVDPPPRLADLGYQGTSATLPAKKKRVKDSLPKDKLTDEQKSWNYLLSKSRIIVEHTYSYSGLKKYQIIRDKYRGKIKTYNLTFKNIAGLHNFCLDNPA